MLCVDGWPSLVLTQPCSGCPILAFFARVGRDAAETIRLVIPRPWRRWRVGPICAVNIILVDGGWARSGRGGLLSLTLTSNQLGVRHFSRFLRSGPPDNSQLQISLAPEFQQCSPEIQKPR